MFDNGVKHLIKGVNINRLRNAIILTYSLYDLFGRFEFFFKPVLYSVKPYTYRIDLFLLAYVS